MTDRIGGQPGRFWTVFGRYWTQLDGQFSVKSFAVRIKRSTSVRRADWRKHWTGNWSLTGSIPTAPTSLLVLYKGLAKSARQQKAAIRANSVGRQHKIPAARMASRRIAPWHKRSRDS